MTQALEEAVEALGKSMQDRFYGEVSFTIKDGEITLIRRPETIVPKTPLRGKNPYAQTNR
jgi:hypothetical protein